MIGYRFASLLFIALFLRECNSKVVVVPVPPDKPTPADGVIYALPNTVVRLQVKIDKTTKSGARFAPYASIFAPDGEPVCKDEKCTKEKEVSYSLQQGTTFATYGEPDPANVFLVKFVGKGAIDQTMSMTWNEAGLLSAASSSVTNRTGDVILSGLKLAAGLGTRAAFGAPIAANKAENKYCQSEPSETDPWAIKILGTAQTSAAALIGNYCSIKKEDRDSLPQNTDLLTDARKAYECNVAGLVAARSKILAGTSTTMEPATLLNHIEAEINQQLTVLFLGIKKTLTWEGLLDVRRVEAGTPVSVLRIDPNIGICLGDSEIPPESKPMPPPDKFGILTGNQCREASPINLTLNYYPDSSRQMFTKINDVTNGERSFRYRIPAQVRANLMDEKKNYGSGVFPVAQLGKVISLPANRHSKTLSYDLAFIEATGGLKTFKLGTTGALDSATVDALGGITTSILDARKADEVNRLTRQDQLLKLQDDICTIQKKYGLPCTAQPH